MTGPAAACAAAAAWGHALAAVSVGARALPPEWYRALRAEERVFYAGLAGLALSLVLAAVSAAALAAGGARLRRRLDEEYGPDPLREAKRQRRRRARGAAKAGGASKAG
jgi:hypothetical protein